MVAVIIRNAYIESGKTVKKGPVPYGPFENVEAAGSWLESRGFTREYPDNDRCYKKPGKVDWAYTDAAVMEVRNPQEAEHL